MGKIMDWVARNAGAVFPLAALVAFISGAALVPGESPEFLLRIPPYLFAIVGLVMLVHAFARAARDRPGEWPTLATLSLFYLFAGASLLILTVLLSHIATVSPDVAADFVPDWLLRGFRFAVCTMIFMAGWAFHFGLSRSWLGRETNPWPLPRFHRAVAGKMRGMLRGRRWK